MIEVQRAWGNCRVLAGLGCRRSSGAGERRRVGHHPSPRPRFNTAPTPAMDSLRPSTGGFVRAPSMALPWTPRNTCRYRVVLTDPVGNMSTSGDLVYARIQRPRSSIQRARRADDNGEADLRYTWSATGRSGASFSVSGSNSACAVLDETKTRETPFRADQRISVERERRWFGPMITGITESVDLPRIGLRSD
jgi:hypothetical protein